MVDIAATLSERQTTHGDFGDHALLARTLKFAMYQAPNWRTLSPEYKEGIDMILHKLARIGAGSPYHLDHVVDIQGYAKLMEVSLNAKLPRAD